MLYDMFSRAIRTVSALGLLAGMLICLAPGSGSAQIVFEEFRISGDINAGVPNAEGPGVFLANDRQTFIVQADGSGIAQSIPAINNLTGVDLDALHYFEGAPSYYSIDTARLINGVYLRPADVFSLSAGQPPTIVFDAEAADIPDNVNLDAVSVDGITGNLLVSFDRYFAHPSLLFVDPGDLIEISGGQLDSIAFDSNQLPDGVNLNAVHWVNPEFMLLSFDVDTFLVGGPGENGFSDDHIVLYSTNTDTFEPLLDLSADSNVSWEAADLDALWAKLAVETGAFRFSTSFREVPESIGSIAVTVQRIDGAETAVQARITSVNGSATSGSDFTAVDEVLSWADGDSASQWFSVNIIDDGIEENNPERFSLQLTVESGDAELAGPSTLQINILDNDGENLFSDGFES